MTKPLLRGGRGNFSINRELYLHTQLIPVNAFYMFVYHVMFIMPSIQFPPYFAGSLPAAARYGGLGHVVGHEITHVFDPFMGTMDQTGVKVSRRQVLTVRHAVSRCPARMPGNKGICEPASVAQLGAC